MANGAQGSGAMLLNTMAESVLTPVLPQIQVTLGCNFRCSYCFQDHSPTRIIDAATSEAVLRKSAEYNRSVFRLGAQATVEVFWHGGEPLLAGVDFFQKMVRVQSKISGVSFKNHIQTNGALLTAEFASFLADNDFQLGFSLDGPKEINDLQRRCKDVRQSAFDAAMGGIRNYMDRMPKGRRVPVISVITKESIDRVAEFYAFFKELGAEVQLDIYDIRCNDLCSSDDGLLFRHAPDQARIGEFLIELFDLWFYDRERRVDFTELREELDRVLTRDSCLLNPFHKKRCNPGRTIFDPLGAVFACDQYVNDSATAIGNINRDSMAAIMRRKSVLWEKIKRVVRRSPDDMRCSSCEWGMTCIGGCLTCMKYNSMLLNVRHRDSPTIDCRRRPLPSSSGNWPARLTTAKRFAPCEGIYRKRSGKNWGRIMGGSAFTVTVEPVSECNLDCRYCYSVNKPGRKTQRDVFLNAIGEVVRYAAEKGFDDVHCVWLGGEPLLAGIDFFERVADYASRMLPYIVLRHFIQTNGLLLNQEFCACFGRPVLTSESVSTGPNTSMTHSG